MAAKAHFLDLVSPETRKRILADPQFLMELDASMQNNQNQVDNARMMTRVIPDVRDDPRERPGRNPGLKYPAHRYHADGRSKVIRSEKEESKDWTRTAPENIHELRAGTATVYDPSIEKLEDENIELKRQLQAALAKNKG